MKKLFIFVVFLVSILGVVLLSTFNKSKVVTLQPIGGITPTVANKVPTSNPTLKPLLKSKTLKTNYHIFQTFNNCGPASLSMALKFYGVNVSQQEIGNFLRPYQVEDGDNDDKSVTLDELAEYSKRFGLVPFYRPNGNIELVKQFINNDIPVITRTWLKEDSDIGHYRIIKGFNEDVKTIIQDDSLQGANLEYLYTDFNKIWQKFNFEYLVLIPKEKHEIAKIILGENYSENESWTIAVKNLKQYVNLHPNDFQARFNLSVAYYRVGDYKKSAEAYEFSKNNISKRSLWYQIEPIQAYYKLGDYTKALELINFVLQNGNLAYSELYIIRGDIYKQQGKTGEAKNDYTQALYYNKNLKEALARVE